jgi:hypothetical protein
MRFSIIFLVCFLFISRAFSQTPKDTCLKMHLVAFQMSAQMPGGDLTKRFGNNLSVGLSYYYKTNKNWMFGIDPNYMFGKNIKEDVLAQLRTPEGEIITSDGNFSLLKLNERGWNITLSAGKIISKIGKTKLGPNPNAGFVLMGGLGYLQHKINIFDEARNVPQVRDDYKKGYDRLTAGLSVKEFIGYAFFSNNRLLNFYGGFEFYQGLTKSLRSYNYDTMTSETSLRLDLLYGFRLGWVLPIYKRKESSNLFTY